MGYFLTHILAFPFSYKGNSPAITIAHLMTKVSECAQLGFKIPHHHASIHRGGAQLLHIRVEGASRHCAPMSLEAALKRGVVLQWPNSVMKCLKMRLGGSVP